MGPATSAGVSPDDAQLGNRNMTRQKSNQGEETPKKKRVVSVKPQKRSSKGSTPQKVPKRKRIQVIVSSSDSSPENADSARQGNQAGRTSTATVSIESTKESNVDSNNNLSAIEREVTVTDENSDVRVTVQTTGPPSEATSQPKNEEEMEQLQIDLQLSDTDSTFSIRTPSPPAASVPAQLSMDVLVEESSPPRPAIRSVVKIPDKKRPLDPTCRGPSHDEPGRSPLNRPLDPTCRGPSHDEPGRSPLNRQSRPTHSRQLDPTSRDPQRRDHNDENRMDTTSRCPPRPSGIGGG